MSFTVNFHLFSEACVVGIEERRLRVESFEGVKDTAGIAADFVVFFPLRVAFKSLPPEGPPSVLHANVIETPEQFIPGQTIDVNDSFSHQNDIFDFVGLERQDIILVFQQDQRFLHSS